MPKNPFIKKLYQFLFISILSLLALSKVTYAQYTEIAAGTNLCAIAKNPPVAIWQPQTIFFGANCDYEVPSELRNKESELLCLKVNKYDTCNSSATNRNIIGEVFYPIQNSGLDWKFRNTIDTGYPDIDACMRAVTKKAFYRADQQMYATLDGCKKAEYNDGNPGSSTSCKASFVSEEAPIAARLADSCDFGDDFYGDVNLKISCYYKSSNNSNEGRIKLNWLPNVAFLCLGEGKNFRPSDGGNEIRSYWVQCKEANTAVKDLLKVEEFYNPVLSNLAIGLEFKINTTNFNRRNCIKCSDRNGDGKVHVSDCPDYTPEPKTSCVVSNNSTCNFGAGSSELERAADAQNCAKTDLNSTLRYKTRFIDVDNKVYFCASNNRTVQCDSSKKDSTYQSQDIFIQSAIGSTRTYSTINPRSGCKYVDATPPNVNCELKNTTMTDASCKFGPLINDAIAGSATNPENCDELSAGEGYVATNSKHVYCSPKNVKVTCDKDTSYQALFNPDVPTSTGQRDYTNKKDIVAALKNPPYNCVEGAPGAIVAGACNVTTDRSITDCGVPSDCFNLNATVPFERIYESDIRKGALYCFHEGFTDPKKGVKYWCPTENRKIVDYGRPSEIFTDNSGSKFVRTTTWGQTNCIKFSEVGEECSKDGDYFDTAAGKKRCSCSTAYNPKYDPLLCGISSSIPLTSCEKVCKLVDVNEQLLEKVEISSPLALIKVASNFLFWAAVMLFIINFISAGLEFVKSGDEPDKVKDAQTRLTNTLFGFIFLIVISGILNYVITLFNTVVR